ncbi:cytochrome c [Halomonas caseinilytica]|uniref:cytochrome c n=1 Tax=Halomonas caseinilytica TaxID=438744 RepID=UPI00084930AB|nr:cytochrome c [Halomonas caseinilytica]
MRANLGLIGLTLSLLASFPAMAATDEASAAARGAYLAKAADCAACHKAANEDGEPYVGGYAIASPMGDIIASNITPSKADGIGRYTQEDFKRALTEGIRKDGAHLYPAMPYTAYRGLTDDDIHALYVYFMNDVAPVDIPTPETDLAFPFNLRFGMAAWNALFLDDPYTPSPDDSAKVDRGHYLVDTLGHCGSCHTPRNMLMGERDDRYLAGASIEGWHAPNITSDPSGIGHWSEKELAEYLKTGHVTGKAQAGGGMAEAVENSLRHLSDEDLHSIAAYLKQVPAISTGAPMNLEAIDTTVPPASLAELEPLRDNDPAAMADGSSTDGQKLYQGACASCHQIDGQGTDDAFYPSLVRNTATRGEIPDNLIMAILHGVHRETNDYTVSMPAFAEELNDEQVAAVSNYVLARYGNADLQVDTAKVAALRAGGPTPWFVQATPWLLAAGTAVIILVLLGIGWFVMRRRKVH